MIYKQGTFYLLPFIHHKNDLNTIEQLVCHLTKIHWRLGKTILITCDTHDQAKKINEALWNFEKNSFLPHGLFSKNTYNIPITIYWSQCCYDNKYRNTLINLMQKNKNFFLNFHEIIDFVPNEDNLKKLARIRYKSYRSLGFNLKTTHISTKNQ
ncbi:DNA polymerase III, chi subunit [Candidatus Blochmanniella floridana]|uniref:DNA polymerase III, chi subunit n=1 Tax=Blochmanniella floridana TaxID=203907 RepID=Q7VQT1_BLOFL|nr:DNA polymerase III, chi subunit [Candidatus Blochmannia floridanus]